jgi:hypothetical protein
MKRCSEVERTPTLRQAAFRARVGIVAKHERDPLDQLERSSVGGSLAA